VPVPTLEISRPSIISIFEVVQEQWKDNIGIEINLVRLEPGQQRRDVVEFRRQSLGVRIPDPSGVLSDLGHSSSGTVKNSGKFSNPQIDALIEAAQSMTLDDPNYCAAWQEIEKTIMENFYYFPLMAGDARTWVVQPWVQGYVGSLGQYFNTLPWWQIGVRDRGLY
jgi:ABC-type transport system substrate-binding protein